MIFYCVLEITVHIRRYLIDFGRKKDIELIASFSLTPKNADSVLKLFDSIKILSFFTDVSALKKPLRTLKFKIYVSMGIKKGKTVYNKILARM